MTDFEISLTAMETIVKEKEHLRDRQRIKILNCFKASPGTAKKCPHCYSSANKT